MSKQIDGCHGSLSVLDTTRQEIRFATEWTSTPDWPKWRQLLDEKYAAMMPFYATLTQCDIGEVYNTAQMAGMIGHPNIYEHPFFEEWALPSGRRDTVGSVVMKSPGRFAMLALHTSTYRDLVGPQELAIGRLLVPHVRRAVTIGDLLGMATARAATLEATLDKMSAAVVVTDAQSRVVLSNAAGDAMLRTGETISTEDGQLRGRQPQATKALRTAIGQSVDPVYKLGSNGIDVPLRDSQGRPAIAHVLPLERGRSQFDWGPRATAAVFVAPVAYPLPSAEVLIALFGLTAMEARVLMEIAEGRNRAQAAAALGIADSTVKTHLDRVFSKTGTSDQASLNRLVRELSSPGSRAD
jgi:DNA-binding CsgD family transcriptional regulator